MKKKKTPNKNGAQKKNHLTFSAKQQQLSYQSSYKVAV